MTDLAKAIRKHGWDAFEHRVVKWFSDEDDALEHEKWLIAKHDTYNGYGYNGSPGGQKGGNKYLFSEEDVDEMVRLYVDEEMSTTDIAEKFGCSKATIQTRLKERGVLRSVAEACRKRSEDPKWRKNQAEAGRKRSEDPKWRKNQAEGARKRSDDPEWQKKQKEGVRKRTEDPKWQKKNAEGGRKRGKPCIVKGVEYPSASEAALGNEISQSWMNRLLHDPNKKDYKWK